MTEVMITVRFSLAKFVWSFLFDFTGSFNVWVKTLNNEFSTKLSSKRDNPITKCTPLRVTVLLVAMTVTNTEATIRWWAKHHLEAIFRFLLFSVKNYLERISLSQMSILGLRLLLSWFSSCFSSLVFRISAYFSFSFFPFNTSFLFGSTRSENVWKATIWA